jgi:nitrilase
MKIKTAVAQIGSAMFDTPATLRRVEQLCREASSAGIELLVFPEALLGGYPKGMDFGAMVGARTEQGRDLFLRYWNAAIDCPGPETAELAAWSRELGLHIVIGVVERAGSTLYCTSLLFTPAEGLATKHRKLVPTASERVIWGRGDGTTMQVTETEIGRIGMAICWENYMPLFRQHLYNQSVQLWCAPTVDARPIWRTSMQHIAYEGRCFVLSACQYLTLEDWGPNPPANVGRIEGGSIIASPFGAVLAGPAEKNSLLCAELDLDDIVRGKFDLDVAGHYNRPDVFSISTR